MSEAKAEIGMIGLGVMGRNLLLNMADNEFVVAGYDRDAAKVKALLEEGSAKKVYGYGETKALIENLRKPRTVMLLVPAGGPVDAVIEELLPLLAEGDLIIDGGNSHFADTDRRGRKLESLGIHYLGMGVSGGEEGARRGPSLMPGGPREAYRRVQPLFEAVAAKVDGSPCVAWLGPGSAGHYVKMVHNGIEYGLMQLIAESYDLMKRGLGIDNARLQTIYRQWNQGELNGFLMEITADIFGRKDERSGADLVDRVRDAARQKGTGMWTSQQALDLQVPDVNVALAVLMRDLSALDKERRQASGLYPTISPTGEKVDIEEALENLQAALSAAFLITYAQGLALLQSASQKYAYGLELETVARIWRGGCIIRAALLEELRSAYRKNPALANPLLDPSLARWLQQRLGALRNAVVLAARQGIPVPGLMGALAYIDAYRSEKLPTNLIQAQRDYFGAHTYERTDAEGTFHSDWKGSR